MLHGLRGMTGPEPPQWRPEWRDDLPPDPETDAFPTLVQGLLSPTPTALDELPARLARPRPWSWPR